MFGISLVAQQRIGMLIAAGVVGAVGVGLSRRASPSLAGFGESPEDHASNAIAYAHAVRTSWLPEVEEFLADRAFQAPEIRMQKATRLLVNIARLQGALLTEHRHSNRGGSPLAVDVRKRVQSLTTTLREEVHACGNGSLSGAFGSVFT
jgi:hypothetical protein